MPVIEPSKNDVPVIPDGTYEVICLGVDHKYVEDDAYGKRDKLVFTLRLSDIVDDEGNEIIFKPQINQAWGNERSNLYKYAVGFGVPCDLDAPINTDHFKGKKAQAFIFTEEEGKYPKITALIPMKKANGQKAPTTVQEARQPSQDTDALAEADALATWFEELKAIGYTPKEILGHAQAQYGRNPSELTAAERDALAENLKA